MKLLSVLLIIAVLSVAVLGEGQLEYNPGECSLWGDPHFTTYDGAYYSFQGEGWHWLMISPQMSVDSHFYKCNGDATCADKIRVNVWGPDGTINTLVSSISPNPADGKFLGSRGNIDMYVSVTYNKQPVNVVPDYNAQKNEYSYVGFEQPGRDIPLAFTNMTVSYTVTSIGYALKIKIPYAGYGFADDYAYATGAVDNTFENNGRINIRRSVRAEGDPKPIIRREVAKIMWSPRTLTFRPAYSHRGKTCGLCGTLDANSKNDFTKSDGEILALAGNKVNEFGKSWANGNSAKRMSCDLKYVPSTATTTMATTSAASTTASSTTAAISTSNAASTSAASTSNAASTTAASSTSAASTAAVSTSNAATTASSTTAAATTAASSTTAAAAGTTAAAAHSSTSAIAASTSASASTAASSTAASSTAAASTAASSTAASSTSAASTNAASTAAASTSSASTSAASTSAVASTAAATTSASSTSAAASSTSAAASTSASSTSATASTAAASTAAAAAATTGKISGGSGSSTTGRTSGSTTTGGGDYNFSNNTIPPLNFTDNSTIVNNTYADYVESRRNTPEFAPAQQACDNAGFARGSYQYLLCMYDVLTSNNTGMANDGISAQILSCANGDNSTLEQCFIGTPFECPSGCNGNGKCISGKCECIFGYGGDDCHKTGLNAAETAGVVTAAAVVGIAIGGAVFLGLTGFGAKKGYDYLKNRDNQMGGVSSNPLYQEKQAGGSNPLYDSKA